MSQVTETLRADLSAARTWVLVNGSSADAAVVSAAITGQPAEPPNHASESATADFRCSLREAMADARLAELRHPAPVVEVEDRCTCTNKSSEWHDYACPLSDEF